jgi:hypothetical protein
MSDIRFSIAITHSVNEEDSVHMTEINLPGPLQNFGSNYIDFSPIRGGLWSSEFWTRDERGRGLENVAIQDSPARALTSVSPSMRGLDILDEILPSIPLSAVETFFWLADTVMSPELLSLDLAIQASNADMELQRDSSKCIDVKFHAYEEMESKDSCTICSDKFQSGDSVTTLLCNHTFHHKCIKEWGHYKPVCPLCKESIALVKENLGTNK